MAKSLFFSEGEEEESEEDDDDDDAEETDVFPGRIHIELLNNNSHGLLPPGGLVSPSGGFVSLLCDQGLHFASIKLCQASWM